MRRAKSLRIGVHLANGVVWGPVYRTHLRVRLEQRPLRLLSRFALARQLLLRRRDIALQRVDLPRRGRGDRRERAGGGARRAEKRKAQEPVLLKENAFSGVRSRRERTTDVFLCDDLYSLYCNSLRSVDAAYAYQKFRERKIEQRRLKLEEERRNREWAEANAREKEGSVPGGSSAGGAGSGDLQDINLVYRFLCALDDYLPVLVVVTR